MPVRFSRREFAQTAVALAAPRGMGDLTRAGRDYYRFPAGFLWGCASSAYQIEGAASEDGRKPSVWDTFAHTPGRIKNADTGDVADDFYHLYKQDVQLLKELGAKTYRYSVAWPRVFPDGTGRPNEKGITFYERVTDELLACGIEPFVTLFHWDLPQAMQDRYGGWESPETSKAFADYAAFVARRLSDRVHHFFTINEFTCFTDEGYASAISAPGLKLPPAQVNQIRHNGLLAHGLAVQAIRAAARPGTKVGLAEDPTIAVPVIETAPHIEAARKAMRRLNAPFLTAVLEGRYMDSYLSAEGANAPRHTPEEMAIIGSPLDFVGVNVYVPIHVRASDTADGFSVVEPPSTYPHTGLDWLKVGPEVAYWAPRHLSEIWRVKDVYISENGCSSDDRIAPDGQIYDTDRVMYVRNHLIHAHRAVSEGFPLRGYFWWSLTDNFEWAEGYSQRFGIYYVDYKTEKRIPKLSASFYREVIARNALV
jgi:beta-glucosidase